MPKFIITAEFRLTTEIEPDFPNLVNVFDFGSESDAEDDSYFQRSEIEVNGGSLKFQVEASDEYDAEQVAGEIIRDGMEVEDNSGLTWLVDSVRLDVEALEEEMTVERAKDIIRTWLTAVPRTGLDGDLIPSEVREALLFLLDRVS